jgi:5-methylcytosine-specific restriction endonuclease McrA
MIDRPVLVLNQNYQPLNICQARRAIVLLTSGRAEMLENGAGLVRSATHSFPLPSVIRLAHMVKRPNPRPKLTRSEVFSRDRYACQYCGKETGQLTLDHVIPRYRGGQHSWENLVAACVPCNRRKAGRTPLEAGMALARPPMAPQRSPVFAVPRRHLKAADCWQKYLPLARQR